MVNVVVTKEDISLRIFPRGCCYCALVTMRIGKHLLVSARRGAIFGESLHWITIASNQGFMVVPINGCRILCLKSKVRHISLRKLRDTHTYAVEKNSND